MSDYKYKLSIITINYNNKKGLEDTFKSVFEQTWQEFEYIVIDGGSTDGSREVIEKYSDKIDYWVSEKDKGIYNALNKGIVKANGEYILCLNSGDMLFEPTILEKIYPELSSGESIIYGDSFDINFPCGKKDFVRKYPHVLSFKFLKENALRHQAVFIKKQLHADYGLYDENFKIVSDWKFMLDVLGKHNVKSKYLNFLICKYDRNGVSSQQLSLNKQERELVLNQEFSFYTNEYEKKLSYSGISIRKIIKFFLPYGIVKLIFDLRKK